MKSITPALAAHLQSTATTMATCWRITRRDLAVFGYTSHDQPLTVGGVLYQAAGGFTLSALDTKEGLNVDNADLQALVLSAEFTEAELMAGKWDFARVDIFQINWASPASGQLMQRSGTLGEVVFAAQDSRATLSGTYRAELRGLMQPLSQQIGSVVSALCRASLGDLRCTINLPALAVAASVATVSAGNRSLTVATLAQPSGHFTYGLARFTSGANAGIAMEVAAHTQGAPTTLVLFEPMPYPIAVGDAITLTPGCDRRFTTCVNRFNNALNFRGEPHLPGQDKLMQPGR